MNHPPLPLSVTHRRYVPHSDAHYAGGLADGAYSLRLFGEVATELSIIYDGDEGLLAGYADVKFIAPIRGGDVLEVVGRITKAGTRSRQINFTCSVTARTEGQQTSASRQLDEPVLATRATGTVVIPAASEVQP